MPLEIESSTNTAVQACGKVFALKFQFGLGIRIWIESKVSKAGSPSESLLNSRLRKGLMNFAMEELTFLLWWVAEWFEHQWESAHSMLSMTQHQEIRGKEIMPKYGICSLRTHRL